MELISNSAHGIFNSLTNTKRYIPFSQVFYKNITYRTASIVQNTRTVCCQLKRFSPSGSFLKIHKSPASCCRLHLDYHIHLHNYYWRIHDFERLVLTKFSTGYKSRFLQLRLILESNLAYFLQYFS